MSQSHPWRRWLLLLPLALGAALMLLLIATRRPPARAGAEEPVSIVRVISVPRVEVIPRAIGYGPVRPAKTWNAVAEVSGRITQLHPNLKRGSLVSSGTLLLRIDPVDYQLQVAQNEASLRQAAARLEELAVEEENLEAVLQIEERALKLAEQELARMGSLLAQGSVAQSNYDQEEQKTLAQRNKAQALRNQLRRLPVQRLALRAEMDVLATRLEQARLDLTRTEIRAPFDGRVAAVNVELAQYMRPAETLAILDGIEVAEVIAQMPVSHMPPLVFAVQMEEWDVDRSSPLDVRRMLTELGEDWSGALGLSGVVRLRSGDFSVEWPARFSRFTDVFDEQTRTVGAIVTVDDPYSKVTPGIRPPLFKGMYCEVELRGAPQPGRLVVPRTAIHGGRAYVAGSDDRLQIVPVKELYRQPEFTVIEAGLAEGDRLIVSDVTPAIEGMRLDPSDDEAALARLLAAARGEAAAP